MWMNRMFIDTHKSLLNKLICDECYDRRTSVSEMEESNLCMSLIIAMSSLKKRKSEESKRIAGDFTAVASPIRCSLSSYLTLITPKSTSSSTF